MSDKQPDPITPSRQDHLGELFSALQRLLPQHTLSRLLGKLADHRHPRLKHFLIQSAMARYGIELEEAALQQPEDYPSFNDFFTRRLRDGARPIDPSPNALVSPADGTVSQLGMIREGTMFQAKGHHFTTRQLLGLDETQCARFHHGSFATIYLSPRDYHRVHMPCDGKLLQTLYVPGRLFSVNDTTTRHIPGLFARNERLVCLFETERGLMAVVLVGAILVAGIRTTWREYYQPGQCLHENFSDPRLFARGEEIGQFRFGSTVVLAMESPVGFTDTLGPGSKVNMGSKLGEWC